MSKIKFDTVLKELDGKEDLFTKQECVILDKDNNTINDKNGNPIIAIVDKPEDKLTLKDIVTSLLMNKEYEDIDGNKKYERFMLTKKINEAKDGLLKLESTEIIMIKDLIGKTQPPLIVGQCYDLLECKDQ